MGADFLGSLHPFSCPKSDPTDKPDWSDRSGKSILETIAETREKALLYSTSNQMVMKAKV